MPAPKPEASPLYGVVVARADARPTFIACDLTLEQAIAEGDAYADDYVQRRQGRDEDGEVLEVYVVEQVEAENSEPLDDDLGTGIFSVYDENTGLYCDCKRPFHI